MCHPRHVLHHLCLAEFPGALDVTTINRRQLYVRVTRTYTTTTPNDIAGESALSTMIHRSFLGRYPELLASLCHPSIRLGRIVLVSTELGSRICADSIPQTPDLELETCMA